MDVPYADLPRTHKGRAAIASYLASRLCTLEDRAGPLCRLNRIRGAADRGRSRLAGQDRRDTGAGFHPCRTSHHLRQREQRATPNRNQELGARYNPHTIKHMCSPLTPPSWPPYLNREFDLTGLMPWVVD